MGNHLSVKLLQKHRENVKGITFLSNLCRNIEKTSKEPPFCQTCLETLRKPQKNHLSVKLVQKHGENVKRTTFLSNLFRNIEKTSKEPPFCQTCPETLKKLQNKHFFKVLNIF